MNLNHHRARAARRLTLFFNRQARMAAAASLKKASWMLTAAGSYLGIQKGSPAFMAAVIGGWVATQSLAVLILSIEEKTNRQPKQEKRHARSNHAHRPRAGRR